MCALSVWETYEPCAQSARRLATGAQPVAGWRLVIGWQLLSVGGAHCMRKCHTTCAMLAMYAQGVCVICDVRAMA